MLNKCKNSHSNATLGTMTEQSINDDRLSQQHHSKTIKSNMDNNRTKNSIYKFIRSQAAMYSSTLIILSTIINLTQAQNTDFTQVFKKLKIVPDLLPNPPQNLVNVEINKKLIRAGDVLNVKDLKNIPTFSWSESNGDARSTIVLLDVDRHKTSANNSLNSYNHLTIINIPGDNVQSGTAIIAYDPPGKMPAPSCHSGSKHRYLVMVYHQNEVVDLAKVIEYHSPSGYHAKREDFKINQFATNLGLTLKAANAFVMQSSEADGLCSGTNSIYQISNWSTSASMIVSTLLMLLMSYWIRDSLQ